MCENGKLRYFPLRSLCWRVYLNLLPLNDVDSWIYYIKIQRKEYEELVKHYSINLDVIFSEDSNNKNSASRPSTNEDLKNSILREVQRVYPEDDLFQLKRTKYALFQILFIYIKENGIDIGYRSGMVDLLAPLYYLFYHQSFTPDYSIDSHVCVGANSEEFIEHDTFIMFRKLMFLIERWYISADPSRTEIDPISKEYFHSKSAQIIPPVTTKCRSIQSKILRDVNSQLSIRLDGLGIDPQLYLMRWLRGLFSREFGITQLLVIWDLIFSYSYFTQVEASINTPSRAELDARYISAFEEAVDALCVSMIVNIQHLLGAEDFNEVLKPLFRYPLIDVNAIISSAVLYLQYYAKKQSIQPDQSTDSAILHFDEDTSINQNNGDIISDQKTTTNNSQHHNTDHHPHHQKEEKQRIVKKNHDQLKKCSKDQLIEKIKLFEDQQTHLSSRIERIIYILQSNIQNPDTDKESLVISVAELKQIKDILSGQIDNAVNPEALLESFILKTYYGE